MALSTEAEQALRAAIGRDTYAKEILDHLPNATIGAALTAAKPTFTIADAEGTPDNAVAAVINASAWGFSNAAELITLLYKVQNMHTRIGELEARLQAAGIIA